MVQRMNIKFKSLTVSGAIILKCHAMPKKLYNKISNVSRNVHYCGY